MELRQTVDRVIDAHSRETADTPQALHFSTFEAQLRSICSASVSNANRGGDCPGPLESATRRAPIPTPLRANARR
jgi:hypothetical protein